MQFNKKVTSIILSLTLISSSVSMLDVNAVPLSSYEEFINKYNSKKYLIKKSQKNIKVNSKGEKEEKVQKTFLERIRSSDCDQTILEIDLHGLHLHEAEELIENLVILINNNKLPYEFDTVKIIPGKGNHSQNGKPVLKPKVVEILKNKGFNPHIPSKNNGIVLIKLPLKIEKKQSNRLLIETASEKIQKKLPCLWKDFFCAAFKCAKVNQDAYHNAWKNICKAFIDNSASSAYNFAWNKAKSAVNSKIKENMSSEFNNYITSHKIGDREWIEAWADAWDRGKSGDCNSALYLHPDFTDISYFEKLSELLISETNKLTSNVNNENPFKKLEKTIPPFKIVEKLPALWRNYLNASYEHNYDRWKPFHLRFLLRPPKGYIDVESPFDLAEASADTAQDNVIENVHDNLVSSIGNSIVNAIALGADCDPVYVDIWENAFNNSWNSKGIFYKCFANKTRKFCNKNKNLSDIDILKNLSASLIEQTKYLNEVISNNVIENTLELDYNKVDIEKIKRDFLPHLWKNFYRYEKIASYLIKNDTEQKTYDYALETVFNVSGQEVNSTAYMYALDEASKFTTLGEVGNFSFYDAIGAAWEFESGVVYEQVIKKSSSYDENYFRDLASTLIAQTKYLKKLIIDNEFNWSVTNKIARIPRLKEMADKCYDDRENTDPIDSNDLHTVLERAYNILCSRPAGLDLSSPIIIAGGIRGHFNSLKCILNLFFEEYSSDESTQCLFLGDYVDRCVRSVEHKNLLFEFLSRFPNSVYVLRGNYEDINSDTAKTLQKECINKYGKTEGLKIWERCNKVFECLPTTVEEISVMRQWNSIEQKWDRFWFDESFIRFLKNKNLKLIKRIGIGSLGNVFEGLQKGKLVAIKISNVSHDLFLHSIAENEKNIHIKMLERFEGQNPKNITLAIFLGNRCPLSVITMPFAELGNLAKRSESNINVDGLGDYTTMWDVKNLVRQLLKGLNELHDKGIVHHDIKPDNILVTMCESKKHPERRKLRYLITDFNVSQTDDEYLSLGQQHFEGAYCFFPPEKHGFYQTVDQAKNGDIFAMGLTMQGALFRNIYKSFLKNKTDSQILDEFYKRNPLLAKSETRNAGILALKELLMGLQNPDPNKRWTLKQARNSEFMKNNYDNPVASPELLNETK